MTDDDIYPLPLTDPKTCADVELDSTEWEIKTITSAIKYYLRYSTVNPLPRSSHGND